MDAAVERLKSHLDGLGKFIAFNEAMVYLVGGQIWKLYPGLPLITLERYFDLTKSTKVQADGLPITFSAPQAQLEQRLIVRVVEVGALDEYLGYPRTISHAIYGPTTSDIINAPRPLIARLAPILWRIEDDIPGAISDALNQFCANLPGLRVSFTAENTKPTTHELRVTDVLPDISTLSSV